MTKILGPVAHLFLRLGHQPRRRDRRRHRRGLRRRAGLLPAGRDLGRRASSSPPSSSPTRSTASWPASRAARASGAPTSTRPSTGWATPRSSAASCSTTPARATTGWMAGLALACLILGSVVSYAKARAEGLGYTANVGIAERADRLVAVLAAAFFADLFDSTLLLGIVLGLLAVASFVTVLQRMLTVRRQALVVGRGGRVSRDGTRSRPAPPTPSACSASGSGGARCARCPSGRHTPSSTGSPTSRSDGAARASQRLRVELRPRPARAVDAPSSTTSCARACAPTCATTARPSGSRRACRARDIERGRARATGAEEPQAVAPRGRPVVVFVGHLGNFDLAAAWSASNIGARHDRRRAAQARGGLPGVRRLPAQHRHGHHPAHRRRGPLPRPSSASRAPAGALVALASDRDLTHNGVEVDLLGHRARMAKGPAVLSLLTGAPLFAASIHYEPAAGGEGLGGHRTVMEFSEPADAPRRRHDAPRRRRTSSSSAPTTSPPTIREHTSSWHMLQKVFVDDLDARRGAPGRRRRASRRPRRRGARREDRDRLPVLVRRARAGCSSTCATSPSTSSAHGHDGQRPRAGRQRDRAARPTSRRRAGPRPCATTAPSPASTSARSRPPRSAGGSSTASSTCCTCTSR